MPGKKVPQTPHLKLLKIQRGGTASGFSSACNQNGGQHMLRHVACPRHPYARTCNGWRERSCEIPECWSHALHAGGVSDPAFHHHVRSAAAAATGAATGAMVSSRLRPTGMQQAALMLLACLLLFPGFQQLIIDVRMLGPAQEHTRHYQHV